MILKNESKYLHLLGMDEDNEMTQHANNALSDINRAFREPTPRKNDYHNIPVYHVAHDDDDPQQKHLGEEQ